MSPILQKAACSKDTALWVMPALKLKRQGKLWCSLVFFFKRRWTIRCLAIKMENTGYGRTQNMKKDKNIDAVVASRLYHKCRLRRIKERGKIWRHYHCSPGWGSWIIQMKSILENNIQLSICSEAVGQTIIFLEATWSQIAILETICSGWLLFSAFVDFELD